jgi:hypothetical protein
MTTKETNTEENTDVVQKSDDTSLVSLVAELVRKQDAQIKTQEETFGKKFEALETLIKEANKNPVDSGSETENKPKTEDKNDVGDKVTIGNDIAPKPSDSQASIIAPAVESSSTDKGGLKMENKADEDEKKDEKKEDVEKTDEDKKDEKKEDKEVSKSDDSEYEIIKTVRPILKTSQVEVSQIPTGYQVLKAIINGWNGKTSSAEESLTIAYNKLESGEFGTGLPTGGYV